jgi:hypothetical protein
MSHSRELLLPWIRTRGRDLAADDLGSVVWVVVVLVLYLEALLFEFVMVEQLIDATEVGVLFVFDCLDYLIFRPPL